MGNVVNLATHRCPIGSLAMHKDFGLVEIVGQNGWMREIEYEHSEPLSLAEESQEVIYAEEIELRAEWVHVQQLIQANLAADIETLRKRGQLLFN
jgi:hypothetical protein